MRHNEEDTISGGRFVQPAAHRLLPPTREYRLQGGRFVPAADRLLPGTREYKIQVDWENAYHFGSVAATATYTSVVNSINQSGGFLAYDAYLTWFNRAAEWDVSGFPTAETNQLLSVLSTDNQNGLFDYTKGYLPMYNLIVNGPGTTPPPPNGGTTPWLTYALIGGAALVGIFLATRKK